MKTQITLARSFRFASLLLLAPVGTVMAGGNHGQLEGLYVPVQGWAEVQEISFPGEPPTQLGTYRIVLKREDWRGLSSEEKRRIRRRLVLEGPMTGVMDLNTDPYTEEHVMGTSARDGALYTAGDYFDIQPGDPDCLLDVKATMNFVQGTGVYEGLESGTMQFEGVVNKCPDHPDFGKSDFEVIPHDEPHDEYGLRFEPLP